MHEFQYDYVKPKYGLKTIFFYMDTDCFIVYIITNNIYKDKDIKTRFVTSNYELEYNSIDRPLSKGKKYLV